MRQLNVLGEELQLCSLDPLTGYYRTGCCENRGDDPGLHVVCVVVTDEFLAFSATVGNDLSTPMPMYRFPGLTPGDRWCVTAVNWLRAHEDGCAAPVVLACTHERTLDVVPLETLREYAVDVPDDAGGLN